MLTFYLHACVRWWLKMLQGGGQPECYNTFDFRFSKCEIPDESEIVINTSKQAYIYTILTYTHMLSISFEAINLQKQKQKNLSQWNPLGQMAPNVHINIVIFVANFTLYKIIKLISKHTYAHTHRHTCAILHLLNNIHSINTCSTALKCLQIPFSWANKFTEFYMAGNNNQQQNTKICPALLSWFRHKTCRRFALTPITFTYSPLTLRQQELYMYVCECSLLNTLML